MTESKYKILQTGIEKELSKEKNQQDVKKFAAYCARILIENKDGKLKYPFMQTKTSSDLAELFKRVQAEGLVFDGVHVTLQSRGITYDYVAYKNKMLTAYPESELDLNVVLEGDEFTAQKKDGVVNYTHTIKDPFLTPTDQNIKGAYMVIKNKRGEFLTTLSKEEIAKHRKVAKADFIWKAWFKEMVLKTIMRKGTKYHFEDEFKTMNETDNVNYDLDKIDDVTVEPDVDPEKYDAEKKDAIKKINAQKKSETLLSLFKLLDSDLRKDDEVLEAYMSKRDKLITKK